MPGKTHILASVAIHAIVIAPLLLNFTSGLSEHQKVVEVLPETELVVEPVSRTALNSSGELVNEETESLGYENDPQIDYAGVPMQPRQSIEQPEAQKSISDGTLLVSGSSLAQQEEVATAEQPFEHQPLYTQADLVQTEGIQVPAFTVANLSIAQMEKIATNGQGLFVVICGMDVFKVIGSLRDPSNLTLVNGGDLICFSQRALNVPIGSGTQIRSKLQLEFGVPAEAATDARIRLLIANNVDHMILARQKQVVISRGLDLKDVVRTTGKFSFLNGQIIDFQISSLVLQDGRVLPAASDGVKSIVGRLTSTLKGGQANEG